MRLQSGGLETFPCSHFPGWRGRRHTRKPVTYLPTEPGTHGAEGSGDILRGALKSKHRLQIHGTEVLFSFFNLKWTSQEISYTNLDFQLLLKNWKTI